MVRLITVPVAVVVSVVVLGGAGDDARSLIGGAIGTSITSVAAPLDGISRTTSD